MEGKGEQSIFTLVDELTKRIKENLNLTQEQIIADIDREVGKKQFLEAIEHFEQTIPLLQKNGYYLPFYFEALALAYFKSGDMKRADEQYQKIIALPTVMIEYGDTYAKSFYMLGKIYQGQGEKDKAIEHYRKFLDLWKDAGPGIAEVDDAREGLVGLTTI